MPCVWPKTLDLRSLAVAGPKVQWDALCSAKNTGFPYETVADSKLNEDAMFNLSTNTLFQYPG